MCSTMSSPSTSPTSSRTTTQSCPSYNPHVFTRGRTKPHAITTARTPRWRRLLRPPHTGATAPTLALTRRQHHRRRRCPRPRIWMSSPLSFLHSSSSRLKRSRIPIAPRLIPQSSMPTLTTRTATNQRRNIVASLRRCSFYAHSRYPISITPHRPTRLCLRRRHRQIPRHRAHPRRQYRGVSP